MLLHHLIQIGVQVVIYSLNPMKYTGCISKISQMSAYATALMCTIIWSVLRCAWYAYLWQDNLRCEIVYPSDSKQPGSFLMISTKQIVNNSNIVLNIPYVKYYVYMMSYELLDWISYYLSIPQTRE